LDLLEVLEARGGQLAIGEIATQTGLPLPTIHRLLATLVERGYVRRLNNRSYALGFRLMPLGLGANALVGVDARPVLADLVASLSENANLAVLVGDGVEYVAQVPSPYSMRMFTEVGRRVDLYCTAVGKALLAGMDRADVAAIVRRTGLEAKTPKTITTLEALEAELEHIRAVGYAMDEQEQEIGVRCVAIVVPAKFLTPMALSVSGPLGRMTDDIVERAVPLLKAAASLLADHLTSLSPS